MKSFRKLLLSKKFNSVLIGIFVGICALILTLFTGSPDSGQNFISEQNLGVQYRENWSQNHSNAIGVSKVYGVPIWDDGQGLGSRMPNLITQPTQSPVIFLGEKLPAEYIVFIRNLIVMLFALIVLNLTVLSWSDRQIYRRLIFMDLALLGPYFLFTSQLDWFVIADQYWGGCLIISGLLHVSWYQTHAGVKKSRYPAIVLFAFVFGLSNLLVGQIMYIPLVVIAGASFIFFNFLNLKKTLGPMALLIILLLLFVLTVPYVIELSNQVWNTKSIVHSSQPSIFDIFVPQELRVYRFQPLLAFVSGGFQPLLRLASKAGPRTEFLNLLFLPFILRNFLRSKELKSPQSRMLRASVSALGLIFLILTFSGGFARSGLPIISTVFDLHAWELAHFFLLIVIVLVTILFGNDQKEIYTSKFFQTGNRMVLATAIVVALLYPVVMVTKDAPRWNPEIITNEFVKRDLDFTVESIGLEKKYRGIFLNEALIQSYRIDKKIVRSGYPLLNSVIYGRSSSTLRYTEQRFRSVFDPSVLDCQPVVLDLLAVNAIVFESTEDDVCEKKLRNYYRSSDEISFIKVPGSSSVMSAKPKQFSSWSIANTAESNPTEPCPLFEKNCLDGLTATKLEPDSGAPFKLCEDKCVFTYKWSAPSSAKQVLVPENYDKTIQIRDLSTGAKFNTGNYQGLLAVEIPSGSTYGEFEATIKPDAMMWARVLATYLHTFVLLATLLLIAVRGFRARRDDKEVVTAS